MATYTGNLSVPGTSATIQIQLIVNQASQSIPNNTSTVNWTLQLVKTSSSGYPYSGNKKGSASAYIDGVKVLTATGLNYNFNGGAGQTLVLGSGSRVITHNSNGTRSVSASGAFNAGGEEIGDGSASGTLTLGTIPRATKPTVSPTSVSTGSALTITHTPAASSFYHDIAYSINGGSTYVNIETNVVGTDTSTSWTPPHTLLPSSESGTAIIRVITRSSSGGTIIGTETVNVPLSVPASIKPTVSSVAWVDTQTSSPNMPSLMGAAGRFVRRWSKLRPTVTSAGAGGSSVTSTQVTMAGQVTSSGTAFANPVDSSGSVSFGATATDSRGRHSDTYFNTVAVKAYDYPILPVPLVTRTSDAAGLVPSPTGTYLRITPNASASSLNFSGEKNLLEWQIRTRPKGGSWTTKQAWTATSVSGMKWTTPRVISSYSASLEHEVEVSIRDLFGKNNFRPESTIRTVVVNVPTESVFMDWNEEVGVGLGKYHSGSGARLQVAGGVEVSTGDLSVPNGVAYAGGVTSTDRLTTLGETRNASNLTHGTVATARLPAATESARGTVERATQAEVNTGTDTTRYVSPLTLKNNSLRGVPGLTATSIVAPNGTYSVNADGSIQFANADSIWLKGIFSLLDSPLDTYKVFLNAGINIKTGLTTRFSTGNTQTSSGYNNIGNYTSYSAGPARYATFSASNSIAWNPGLGTGSDVYVRGEATFTGIASGTASWAELRSFVASSDRYMCFESSEVNAPGHDGFIIYPTAAAKISGNLKVIRIS